MLTWTLLLTVFLGSLVSGWHCALMCGGVAASLEKKQDLELIQVVRGSKRTSLMLQFLTHTGRITTYVILGGVLGALGWSVWQQNWMPIQRPLFGLAAGLFLLQGYRILRQNKGSLNAFDRWINRASHEIWLRLNSVFHERYKASRFLKGMLWGFLPCGLVYGVLPLAFLSGDALSGGLIMLAFGLGTLPNLMLISGFSAYVAQWTSRAWARYLIAAMMFLTGALGMYRAITLPQALIQSGFCIS